jgi:hypothetical protein
LSGPGFLAAGCGFAYWALLTVRSGGDRGAVLVYALLAIFFVYLGAFGLRWLLRRNSAVTISEEGIKEEYFGFGLVQWNELLGLESRLSVRNATAFKTLYLKVQDPRKYFERIPLWVRPILWTYTSRRDAVPLDFTYLDRSIEEAIEQIKTVRPDILVA